MHAEWDHLVTVFFQELRERVEQLGLEFFDVDLLWGVPAKLFLIVRKASYLGYFYRTELRAPHCLSPMRDSGGWLGVWEWRRLLTDTRGFCIVNHPYSFVVQEAAISAHVFTLILPSYRRRRDRHQQDNPDSIEFNVGFHPLPSLSSDHGP